MDTLKTQFFAFINSPQFWKWHGFVLTIFWLIGSSIGILLKKKHILLHLVSFLIVDYISLFFMGCAIYLTLPKLGYFSQWVLAQKVHVILGLLFLGLMSFQHIQGAITWHKQIPSRQHRQLGPKIALLGRIVATIGWIIHYQDNKYYAIGTAIMASLMFVYVQMNKVSLKAKSK